ncbi:uncharacterized protein J4E84_005131 [Alternaria hordeiaustralica]|uniref:uncharacterized protein n=1 Tax=Alternaria hordeiaustralica TaxID=1187925 RepID=UPI0020C432C7|nr:uncharacterized protein J4E84_005131 [Alternaria hordeiaustralica]KAI4688201.1 hypothetical protein J4E84_005131 [Alternaria hordeiaustralica]
MTPPIDPLRARIFSELNLQLTHPSIPKPLLNECSKHLAFLVRYYANDPDCNPLRVSVPIVEVPVVVPRVGMAEEEGEEEDEEDVEIEIGLKIALVVFEEKKRKSSVQTRMEGLRKMKMERLYGVGKVLGEEEETEDDSTPTMKMKSDDKAGGPVSKIAGFRHCLPASASGTGTGTSASASASSPAAKPRMRVLIETTGTLGHYKCLVAKLCGMAERVIAGLLDGDEDMVRACEEVRRNKGKNASADVGKRPVWDVEACGEWC